MASSNPAAYEYYVHFVTYDRRLDEWVTYDRIDTKTHVVSNHGDNGEDSKYKRHKRKLDNEIHDNKEKEALGIPVYSYLIYSCLFLLFRVSVAALEKEHEEITKVKNINQIVIGKYQIDTWYFSPYPDEYCGGEKLYLCEFCLKYMSKEKTLLRHSCQCTFRSPPGREVYRDGELSLFEVDGKDEKVYCQNLCLLSKLFLDHKTLYYDVDPFLFYILCETDKDGSHIVGYFSKEKQSRENYNLACILTFPPYQRKGYGKMLISLSYELTKRENTTGSPEKPLSDLGRISYRSYWQFVILKVLQEDLPNITVQEIGRKTGIKTEDIISTLHSLNVIKHWKGTHVLYIKPELLANTIAQAKRIRLCNPSCLTWQPPAKK